MLRKLHSVKPNDYAREAKEFKTLKAKATRYFASLPTTVAKEYLYEELDTSKATYYSDLIDIIDEVKLLDLDRIAEMMNAEDFAVRKRAVHLLKLDKQHYTASDLDKLRVFLDYILSSYGKRGETFTKKKLMKEQEMWCCECGEEMSVEQVHCSDCGRDIYGFKKGEANPDDVIPALRDKIRALEDYLSMA